MNTNEDKDLENIDDIYPLLPLRDIVVYPNMIVPLFVGREKSILALEEVMKEDKCLILVAQKDSANENPTKDDIYEIGTIATVLQLLKLPDNTVKVLVEGSSRAKIKRYLDTDNFYQVEAELIDDDTIDSKELTALARTTLSQFESYVKLNRKIPSETYKTVSKIEDYSKLADTIASNLEINLSDKQKILETHSIKERLELVYAFIDGEIDVLQTEKRIRGRVKRQMEKTQREYYLNEQMKAIQKELGKDTEDASDELDELETKLLKLKLSKEAREKTNSELKNYVK
jgi:ATP-dependent Lon protease